MLSMALTIGAVFGLLGGSEYWWRTRYAHGEFSRKFVHITVGSFVAFWPFYLPWNDIRLLALAFLIVVSISKYLNIFRTIHTVQRPTWGELSFALTVGLITFVTQNKWIYMAAILQMSLADGLAAIVGTRYGQPSRYHVFGQPKSVVGTAAFFLVSVIILVGYHGAVVSGLSWAGLIALAAGATLVENAGISGLDNLLVPLLVAVVLQRLS